MLPHKTKLFFDEQAMITLKIDDLMENKEKRDVHRYLYIG